MITNNPLGYNQATVKSYMRLAALAATPKKQMEVEKALIPPVANLIPATPSRGFSIWSFVAQAFPRVAMITCLKVIGHYWNRRSTVNRTEEVQRRAQLVDEMKKIPPVLQEYLLKYVAEIEGRALTLQELPPEKVEQALGALIVKVKRVFEAQGQNFPLYLQTLRSLQAANKDVRLAQAELEKANISLEYAKARLEKLKGKNGN